MKNTRIPNKIENIFNTVNQNLPLIPFNSIQINKSEIEQILLDIENKQRSNLFGWRGQFSPQLIETLLERYTAQNSVVIDPFLGSGTVLYECARKGLSAFGNEINPSAYYMSKIYELCIFDAEQRIELLRQLDRKLLKILETNKPIDSLLDAIKSNSEIDSNIFSLLIVLMDLFKNNFSFKLVLEKWGKIKSNISELPFSNKTISAQLGDARYLNIDDNTADLILTSPPYINVFNYHQEYRRSVEVLGFDVLKIAKCEVGSNRKNRGNRFLTVIQYCLDMTLAINEMIRVLKPKSRIILVVGRESNVLKESFCNSEIIYDIACGIFGLTLLLRQDRCFKNKFGQIIYEDILHFSNTNPSNFFNEDNLINISRQISVNALNNKLLKVDTCASNKLLLSTAIEQANLVNPSEKLKGISK
ncbi:MAG: hypothetical protein LBE38_11945 [Deltaproteobacteria bacterium]|jgi:DNA modification methylase|nr:hypothetical protein [Deltaproteobacteria bacterium]